jgi:nucleoside-diphosphate-sugar epimerase
MSDYLDGRHVLLTGVTGFLGQATLEKLLSAYPTTRICVLIRPKGSQPAANRLPGLLRKDVFKNWRERVGDEVVEQTVAERVTVVEGDLGNDRLPQLPDDLDVVVHSASIVSFDPPIDEAFRINVIGVTRLYDAIKASARASSTRHPWSTMSTGEPRQQRRPPRVPRSRPSRAARRSSARRWTPLAPNTARRGRRPSSRPPNRPGASGSTTGWSITGGFARRASAGRTSTR